MKSLIVNADDFGADAARNRGILHAIHSGAVTAVSILANGFAIDDALARIEELKDPRLSFGVHFNVSEGKPLTERLRLLTGTDGCFLGKKSARQLLANEPAQDLQEEIRAELTAQISRLRQAGIRLDHLDGHQHLHLFPAALGIIAKEALENGIRWIRIADERLIPTEIAGLPAGEVVEAREFIRHAANARRYLWRTGLCAPDHFRGLFFKGKLPDSTWAGFLESLSEGLTELMVHPGYAETAHPGPFSSFSTPQREGELNALTDGRFLRALNEAGINLTPFPEAAIH
jgi:chitin disaccharide deacetylase